MKKRNYTLTTALTAALCCLICLLNGCTRDNDIDIPQTSINTIGATTVQPGETITLTGANMHLISKVYFGDATTIDIKTPQAERNHQSLTVYVPTEVFEETKVVPLAVLYNSVHRLVVCEELTVYIAPVIPTTSTTLSGEVKPGDIITITGTDLGIIKALQANGESITIDNKKATEITFKAPEVDTDTEFTITLVYDNSLGNDQKLIVPGKIKVKEVIPAGSITGETQEVETGKDITIEGTNLNVVKAVRLTQTGGASSDIAITNPEAAGFTFKAPEVDADTEFAVTLIYGKSDKETASIGTVKVKKATVVLPYYYWENVIMGAQGTDHALFDAITGRTVSPCDYATGMNIDFALLGNGSNQPARLSGPSKITSVFKNGYKCQATEQPISNDDYTVLMTTILSFKKLATTNSTENALIEKIKNNQITDISDDIGSINLNSSVLDIVANNELAIEYVAFDNTTTGKKGLIRIKEYKQGTSEALNEIVMDVYYEK